LRELTEAHMYVQGICVVRDTYVTRTSRRIYSNAAAQSGVGELDFRLEFMCCKQTFMQRTMMHIGEFGGMAPRRSDPLKKLAYKSIIPQ